MNHKIEGNRGKRFCTDVTPTAKKRRLSNTSVTANINPEQKTSVAIRNRSFANDRLKRLRSQLNSDKVKNNDTKIKVKLSPNKQNPEPYTIVKRIRNTPSTTCCAINNYHDEENPNNFLEENRHQLIDELNGQYEYKKLERNVEAQEYLQNDRHQNKSHISSQIENSVSLSSIANDDRDSLFGKTSYKKLLEKETLQEARIFRKNNSKEPYISTSKCPVPKNPQKNKTLSISVPSSETNKNVLLKKSTRREVDSQNGLLNIRVRNSNLDKEKSESEIQTHNKISSTQDGLIKLFDYPQSIAKKSSSLNPHNIRFEEGSSKNNTFKSLNKSINVVSNLSNKSVSIAKRRSAPGQLSSSIQERLKKQSLSCTKDLMNSPSTSAYDSINTYDLTKSYQNSSTPFIVSTSQSVSQNEKQDYDSLKNKCSSELQPTKFWINYGQIINSLYMKYFRLLTSIEDVKLQSNGDGNTYGNEGESSMDWEESIDLGNNCSNTRLNNLGENEKQELYIVVDTNIFLSELDVLKEIVSCGSHGGTKPILYVPWMVLSELDFMKDNRNTAAYLKDRAHKAVEFINQTLIKRDRKLIGQNVYEADRQMYVGKSPDDKIISCCLQAKEKYHSAILLTNDVNLKNKSLVNDVPSLSVTELLRDFSEESSTDDRISVSSGLHEKTLKVLSEMSNCCSYIICECAKDAYGSVWNKMAMLQNPPWSLKECLRIFKKYWSSVFREKLLKQFSKPMDELSIILRKLDTTETLDIFNELVDSCLSFCFFLKDLEKHKKFIEDTIKEIKIVANCQL